MIDSQKKIAVCVVNWNNSVALRRCVEHLQNQSISALIDIWVVDNSSEDDSVVMLRESFLDVHIIQIESNTGGAGGFARGMLEVSRKNYSYIWLLDNDAYPERDCAEKLFHYLESHPEVGVLGSKIEIHSEPGKIQECGGAWNIRTGDLILHSQSLPSNEVTGVRNVDYVAACSAMLRSELIEKVGTFDPQFFLFYDDVEFCYRVGAAGYRIAALADTYVRHEYFGDKALTAIRYYYTCRNRLVFFMDRLSMGFFDRLGCGVRIVIKMLIESIAFELTGRQDLVQASRKAVRDYLKNRMGKLNTSIDTFELPASEMLSQKGLKSAALIGFRSVEEIGKLMESFTGKIDWTIFVEKKDYPLCFPESYRSNVISQIPYERRLAPILQILWRSIRKPREVAIVKYKVIDCFSFLYSRVYHLKDQQFMQLGQSYGDLKGLFRLSRIFLFGALSFICILVKSTFWPSHYGRG